MQQSLLLFLEFLLGIVVGTYGTLVGVGGGFLLMPIFLLAFGLSHSVAAGTSLAIICVNALSGVTAYLLRGKIDLKVGIAFTLFTLPGAYLGTLVSKQISGPIFSFIFGAFLVALALYLLRKTKKEAGGPVQEDKVFRIGLPVSTGVGLLSSLFGIGGGILHVPLMVRVFQFPLSRAVATSQFILLFTAIVGTASYGSRGDWQLSLVLPIGLGTVLGGQIGSRLASKVNPKIVMRLLVVGMVIVGLRLIASIFI